MFYVCFPKIEHNECILVNREKQRNKRNILLTGYSTCSVITALVRVVFRDKLSKLKHEIVVNQGNICAVKLQQLLINPCDALNLAAQKLCHKKLQ